MKFSKLFFLALVSAFSLWPLALLSTPVMFPLKSFFYGANYTRGITITAVHGTLTDGTNLFVGSFINVTPAGNTNPVVNLAPNDYTITFADVRTPLRFSVPDSPTVQNILTLITNGLSSMTPVTIGAVPANIITNGAQGVAIGLDTSATLPPYMVNDTRPLPILTGLAGGQFTVSQFMVSNSDTLYGPYANISGGVTASTFTGSGNGLTGLRASQLTGAINASQLAGTVSSTIIPGIADNSVGILFIGDSITFGGGSTAGNPSPAPLSMACAAWICYSNMYNLKITSATGYVNAGVSGARSWQWLTNDASGYFTNAVVLAKAKNIAYANVMIGINDAGDSLTPLAYSNNVLSLVTNLFFYDPQIKHIWLNWWNYVATDSIYATNHTRVNSNSVSFLPALVAIAKSVPNVSLGDTNFYTDILNATNALADGLHPNSYGHQMMGLRWSQSIAPYFMFSNTVPPVALSQGIPSTVQSFVTTPSPLGTTVALPGGQSWDFYGVNGNYEKVIGTNNFLNYWGNRVQVPPTNAITLNMLGTMAINNPANLAGWTLKHWFGPINEGIGSYEGMTISLIPEPGSPYYDTLKFYNPWNGKTVLTVGGNSDLVTGAFSGNGAGLTNLNSSALRVTNAPVNGYALRYTNGNFYWAP